MTLIPIPEGLQTKVCVLGDHVLEEIPTHFRQNWPGKTPVLIADENTWAAAGRQVDQILKAAGLPPAQTHIFPGTPKIHADYAYVKQLVPIEKGYVPIVVGSGTLNDLVKRSSFEAETGGYMCVATAPSVDGYTAAGAALLVDGFKKTVPCPAPLVILADNAVIRTAPMPMVAAGYADLAAKIIGGADWYLAAGVGEEPIDPIPWNMVQKNLRKWLGNPEAIKAGDSEALAGLFEGLANTGFSIQYYIDSRPASGSEHLFSHIWEMDNLMYQGDCPSHGFKVGIGTLISTAMFEELFSHSQEEMARICDTMPETSPEKRKAQVDALLEGSPIHKAALDVSLAKLKTGEALRKRRATIVAAWPELKEKTSRQLFPFQEMRSKFVAMGCPVNPSEIGADLASLRRAVYGASMIRKRYTILDTLMEVGLFDQVFDSIVNSGKYFTI